MSLPRLLPKFKVSILSIWLNSIFTNRRENFQYGAYTAHCEKWPGFCLVLQPAHAGKGLKPEQKQKQNAQFEKKGRGRRKIGHNGAKIEKKSAADIGLVT